MAVSTMWHETGSTGQNRSWSVMVPMTDIVFHLSEASDDRTLKGVVIGTAENTTADVAQFMLIVVLACAVGIATRSDMNR